MMTFEVTIGRCLQVAGKLWECWGALTGNELRRTHGYQLVIVGQMRVLGAQAADLLRYCSPRQALRAAPIALRPAPRR